MRHLQSTYVRIQGTKPPVQERHEENNNNRVDIKGKAVEKASKEGKSSEDLHARDLENIKFIKRLGFGVNDIPDLEAGNFDISGLFPSNLIELVCADKDLNPVFNSFFSGNANEEANYFKDTLKTAVLSKRKRTGDVENGEKKTKVRKANSNGDISKDGGEGSTSMRKQYGEGLF